MIAYADYVVLMSKTKKEIKLLMESLKRLWGLMVNKKKLVIPTWKSYNQLQKQKEVNKEWIYLKESSDVKYFIKKKKSNHWYKSLIRKRRINLELGNKLSEVDIVATIKIKRLRLAEHV